MILDEIQNVNDIKNIDPKEYKALAEEIRHILDKDVDVFEINEINVGSEFYDRVMEEKVLVA